MNSTILEKTMFFGTVLLLATGLVSLVQPARAAAASQNAQNFCQDQSGALQSICEHGYDVGNTGADLATACGSYNTDPAKLKACQAGFNRAHEDPAIKCGANQCDFVGKYVNPAINLLSVSFGLIAVISLIMGGIQYSTSEGDPQKSASAKSRITNTIVAIFAYLFLYAFLQFLVPGGAFH